MKLNEKIGLGFLLLFGFTLIGGVFWGTYYVFSPFYTNNKARVKVEKIEEGEIIFNKGKSALSYQGVNITGQTCDIYYSWGEVNKVENCN